MKRIGIAFYALPLCLALFSCGSTKVEDAHKTEQGGADIENTGAVSLQASFENVAYGSASSAQVLDVYLPAERSGKSALLVLVHGGAFKFGDQKAQIFEGVMQRALQEGYVVASVDYRKSDEARFPAAVADVKAAVRFLKADAQGWGIDTERVAIWGESAGAYLALMTTLTPQAAILDGDVTDNLSVSSGVRALVSFYAPVEFYTLSSEKAALGIEDPTNSAFEADFVGQALDADKEATYKTWWKTYSADQPLHVQCWIQAGTADTNVPYTQSENLATSLAETIGEDSVHFSLIEGAKHMDEAFYSEENLSQVFAFLAAALK